MSVFQHHQSQKLIQFSVGTFQARGHCEPQQAEKHKRFLKMKNRTEKKKKLPQVHFCLTAREFLFWKVEPQKQNVSFA